MSVLVDVLYTVEVMFFEGFWRIEGRLMGRGKLCFVLFFDDLEGPDKHKYFIAAKMKLALNNFIRQAQSRPLFMI